MAQNILKAQWTAVEFLDGGAFYAIVCQFLLFEYIIDHLPRPLLKSSTVLLHRPLSSPHSLFDGGRRGEAGAEERTRKATAVVDR